MLAAGCCAAENDPKPAAMVLSLEQAYDIVLATDQSLRIAILEVKKANLLPWRALTALGPQISGDASYSASEQRVRSNGVTSRFTGDSRQAGFTLQQPLIDFAVPPTYRLGKLTSRAARLQYRFAARETLFGVAQAYYEVLKQQKLVAVNQQTVDLAGRQLDQAQKQYSVGVAARSDVLRATGTLEAARSTLIQSKGVLEVSLNTLLNILNLDIRTVLKLVEPPDMMPAFEPFDEVLASAYERREDHQISKIAIDQAIARRNQIAGDYGPRIVAQAGTQWSETHSNTGGSSVPYSVDGVISVQMPFLTGGQREIDLRSAGHDIEAARQRLSLTVQTIEADVKEAYVQTTTLRESIKAQRAAVEAATQNYNDVQSQYQAGTATSLDVQSALRDLSNARVQLTAQLYGYQVGLRNLERARASFQQGRISSLKDR